MALVYFSWINASGAAQSLLLDASPSRTHTTTAQVTEHPVEKGSPVTDYIRPMPRRLTVEGFITNTPIGAPPGGGGGDGVTASLENREYRRTRFNGKPELFSWSTVTFSEDFDRVADSFAALVSASTKGYLFDITTSLTQYTNMAATNFTVTESAMGADALSFTIEFQELRIVSTQVVAVPVRKKIADVGTKVPASADADAGKKKALQSAASATVSGPDAP